MRRLLGFLTLFVLVGLLLPVSIVKAADDGTVIVQTIPGPTVAEKLGSRVKVSWPWYLTRASGLIAAVTLIILMLSGIGQVTGYTFRFLDPLTSWASHRALGIAFSLSVVVHVVTLLFDKFIKFNIWHVLVPWYSSYRPVTLFGYKLGSLYLALGIVAFYLTAIVTITSLVWVEKKPYLWKIVHLLSYIIILFVFVHALYIGTDLARGIFRLLWLVFGVSIAWATIHRLWRAKTT